MSSKRKGTGGERELAQLLRSRGHDVFRTYASGAGLEKGDLGGFRSREGMLFHIECKRQERIDLHRWWRQASSDCPPDAHPLVIFRRNREDWRVVLSLETLLELVEEKNISLEEENRA